MKPSLDFKREIISSKDAQSISEIVKETCLSDTTIRRHAKEMVRLGKWKEGYRKTKTGFEKVYIKTK